MNRSPNTPESAQYPVLLPSNPRNSAPFARVCVYCGASDGVNDVYTQQASALGTEIARRDYSLIYGGGTLGLMGAVSRAAHAGGATVHGIIPGPLAQKESSGETVGYIEIVDTMHQRKARMAELADVFIALPGGFGTLEELFETITWIQLGIHRKPVGLLNVDGFFDPLQQLINHQIEQGFIRPKYGNLLVVEEEPALLLDSLARHEMPSGIVQWITSKQT